MLSITKVNNSIKVEGLDNKQFPDNGTLMIPLNSVILTLDESNIATFRSAANNDVLFSGVITDIQISGTPMTKQTITTAFTNVANSSGGGGGTVDAYTKAETDALLATKANESELSDYATVESLATVATSGSYDDLSNKPTIPVVPTDVSAFTNDAGYITQEEVIINEAFPNGWHTTGTMADLIADINADTDAVAGKVYMDTVSFSDLPANMQQAELKAEIISQSGNSKVIVFTVTSSEVSPYHWEYTSAYGQTNSWREWVTPAAMQSALSVKANSADLATVATTGSYNDLANKPTIPAAQIQSDWNQSDNSAADYIKNKPVNVSAFTNDAGYLTQHQSLADYSTTQEMNTAIATATNDMATMTWVGEQGYLTQHQDISGLATKSELAEVEAEIPSLEGYATEQWVENQNYLTEHQSLDNYYTKAQTDTAISTATNDMATETWVEQQGYLTQHQDISGLATKTELSDHTGNTTIHVTALDKTNWNAKAELSDIPDVTGYINGAVYDSQTKRINFKHGDTVVAYIDATPFVVDGMVDTVEITGGNLVITWNTDAGKQSTSIPLTDIFNPDNYYNKTDTDTLLAAKANSADLAAVASSGDYDDLVNKPTIPTVPTNVSAFTNDAGYTTNEGTITGITMNGVSKGTSGNVDLGTVITEHQSLAGYVQDTDLAAVAISGDYDDLSNKPSIPTVPTNVSAFTNDAGYVQSTDLATVATSGDYDDLTNKPAIPTVPTNVSAFTNDAGYTTNTGTITGITMNGTSKGTSGVVDLGTVVTDISGKQDVIDASHKLDADLVDDTTSTNKFVTASDKSTWNSKQDELVSGTNIKTINNESILGSGNIDIQGGSDINVVQTTGTSTTDVMSQNAVTNAFNGTTYGSPSTLNNSFVADRTAYAIIYDVSSTHTSLIWYLRCKPSPTSSFTTIGIAGDDNFYDNNHQIMTDIPDWIDQELSYYDSTTRKRYVFLKNGAYADYFSNVNGDTFTIFETYNTGLIGQLLSKHSIDTDAHTTSAEKTIWNAKLDSSVITTSITSSSTDSQIPSAKAVYDALQEGGGSSYTAGDGIDITNDVISVDIDDEKKVIASALTELHNDKVDKNQLNNYQLKGDYQTGAQVDTKIATATSTLRTEAEAINVEKVDAAALTDLNARVSTLEQGGGGSGITGITMNGSAVTVTSGVADLGTVVTDKSDKQDVIDSSHKLSADLVDDTNTTNKFVTASDKTTWGAKQDALVSGTNIKTINNESILGSGNITIQGGGGTTYTAGDGIDITNDVISNTREQRVLRYDDTITGVKAALQVVSPHWDYSNETVSDPANNLTFVNNVPAANADPYVQANYLDGTLMEFEVTDYSEDSSSDFSFDLSEVSGGVMFVYNESDDEWEDEVAHGVIYTKDSFDVGMKIRMNNTMFSALMSAMQADCPYETMEVQYNTYAWNTNKSVNAIHSGTSYPLAYNSDLTALAARVTALETALGNISSSLDTINGEVI